MPPSVTDGRKASWQPTLKQEEALISEAYETLYGGSRGGGKSEAGMAWMLYDIDNPRFKGLVIRRNAVDLSDWISRAKHMYIPTKAVFTANPARIVFPSGATITLGHLADANAFEHYQGHEYHKILIEELTQIASEELYLKLLSSCRSTVAGLRPQIFCTTNPGGPGAKWVKLRWRIEGTPKQSIYTIDQVSLRDRVFIPARVDDNPYLMKNDPDYVRFLDGLPDGLREQWRLGSWDDVEIKGSYYMAMYKQAKLEGRISREVAFYDPALPVFTVWDLGMKDAMSIGFFQKKDGMIKMIDFYEKSNEGLPHFIKVLKEKPYIYKEHFAPHDIEVREQTTGKTRRETAVKLGLEFTVIPKMGLNDRIDSARLVWSRMWINEVKCEDFCDKIKFYRKEWDEKNLCFKDKPLHDYTSNAADMFSYMSLVEEQFINPQEENIWEQPDYEPMFPGIGI